MNENELGQDSAQTTTRRIDLSMLRDVLARATPASMNDTSIGVYARLRPGAEAGTEVEVKRKAGEQRHVQVRSEAWRARIAIARMPAAA